MSFPYLLVLVTMLYLGCGYRYTVGHGLDMSGPPSRFPKKKKVNGEREKRKCGSNKKGQDTVGGSRFKIK